MGRYIYCDGEYVWKYVFARQSSEQGRIYEELGLGSYSYDDYGDSLTLTMDDVPALKEYLKSRNFDQLFKEFIELPQQYEGQTLYHDSEGNVIGEAISFGSPLDEAQREFQQTHDFYFLEMIDTMVRFMEERYESSGQIEFIFNGEF